jgi:hypothetical protein
MDPYLHFSLLWGGNAHAGGGEPGEHLMHVLSCRRSGERRRQGEGRGGFAELVEGYLEAIRGHKEQEMRFRTVQCERVLEATRQVHELPGCDMHDLLVDSVRHVPVEDDHGLIFVGMRVRRGSVPLRVWASRSANVPPVSSARASQVNSAPGYQRD